MPRPPKVFCCHAFHAAHKFAARSLAGVAALFVSVAILSAAPQPPRAKSPSAQPRFAISFSSNLSATPLDGRVYVVISTTNDPEPRDQILEVRSSLAANFRHRR